MKVTHLLAASVFVFATSAPVFAGDHEHKAEQHKADHAYPDHQKEGKEGGHGKAHSCPYPNKGGKKDAEHKQKMMAMKQAHMQRMEKHMDTMEALMTELVELQKAPVAK